jgi:ERCC4-related helicase
MTVAPHQACFFAHDLTRLGAIGELDRLSTTLFDSKVDLNPHQVEAALFAISNPLREGALLADEVGLGKTIEAGLVLCQKWAERQRKLIVVVPAHIRKQWQSELSEKFNLPSRVIDRKVWNQIRREGNPNPFNSDRIVIISYGFAARMKDELRVIPFDLVVLDEAHKLRNAYQPSRKSGKAIRWAFELRQKILLTATPLQNSLLELYGLGWIIGDHVFGDKSSFQSRYCNSGGDIEGLRERLSKFCKRTLRKDCPYVNYTKRQALTHPFAQTSEEKQLHQQVMDFMSREISFAFPHRQRHLIELILFKTLASSPQALAGTLRTMRRRLIDLRDGLTEDEQERFISTLAEDDDDLDIEMFLDEVDDLDDESSIDPGVVDGRLLAAELAELDALIDRAERINFDSKSKALLTALDAAFERLDELGAKRKALIFTESRKTQTFLANYLESNGYAGKVVTFNGSNTHPSAKAAYDRFLSRHAGTDKVTGSKAIDVRSALIEEFRDESEILLATEAAAEGVNLQFCSLVVNYDLPWNPQRIEQRIGRCHRYGQLHDVVVVNFLSEDNLADRRVQDLLQQKFSLFDGLFGASDEVLGAIQDGVDFEKRVLAILKTCRTDQEIESAFDALQEELEEAISSKMDQARQQLLEHFDADVHEVLTIKGENARLALDRVGERFWRLTHWGLDDLANFDDERLGLFLPKSPAADIPSGEYRLISAARTEEDYAAVEAHLLRLSSPLGEWIVNKAKEQTLPVSTIRFDVTTNDRKISMLEPLVGQSGYLCLDKLTLESDACEEFLLFTGISESGENIDQEVLGRLFEVGTVELGPAEISVDIATRLATDSHRLQESTIARAGESGNERFKHAQDQVNQWADDKIAAAEIALDTLRREIRAARRASDIAETVQLREEAERAVAELERKRRRLRRDIFDLEDEIEIKRKELIQGMRDRMAQKSECERLYTIRWIVQ